MSEVMGTILVAGDLAPLGRPEQLLVQGETKRVFGGLLDVIRTCDCFLVNLECPLTRCNERLSKAGSNLKAAPEVAPALKDAGISVVSLANNHIFDYGLTGIRDTTDALDRSSVRWYGVGANCSQASTPLIVDLSGIKVAFLAYAEHEFNWHSDREWCTSMLNAPENILQIQNLKREIGAVVVFLHGGPEGTHFPSPRVVKLSRAFAEAGASAVVISHSHAVMGSEVYRGVPIAYGLGNFLFDKSCRRALGWRLGLMARLTVHADQAVDLETIPLFANAETGCIDLIRGEDLESFREFHRSISEPLRCMHEVEERWKSFCASQVPHLTKEILKGLSAILPGGLLFWLLRRRTNPAPESYYRKGANILRGLMVCENHQEMLGQIFDLLRENQLWKYRGEAKSLRDIADHAFTGRRTILRSHGIWQ